MLPTPPSNPPTELAKTYSPSEHETRIRERWMGVKAFGCDPQRVLEGKARPYSILIPPPNVTARLHLGHALNNTLQDVLIRAKRMMGFETLWMAGTDHAGIATQAVVEKRLWEEEKLRKHDLGREAFVARVQAWKDDYEKQITDQLKLMGCSCDFDRQRFTMDEICAKAVREAFFRLFRDGLIYRGKRLVNWDPALQTAVADDECFEEEIDTSFWYLRYPVVRGGRDEVGGGETAGGGTSGSSHSVSSSLRLSGTSVTWDELARLGYPGADQHPADEPAWVTVATTRPETYLADTAVAINPHDSRAIALRGLSVKLPLVGRVIPIVEDSYVVLPEAMARNEEEKNDPKAKFATGFLKVTPGHDKNDWELGQRHKLPVINMMSPDGNVSDKHGWTDVGSAHLFVGLSMMDARKKVVAEFKSHGLLEAVKPYRQSVTYSDRSKAQVEPYLSDQWYVRVTDPRMAASANAALVADQRSDQSPTRKRGVASGEAFGLSGSATKGENETHSGPRRTLARASGSEVGGSEGEGSGGDGSMRFHPDRYAKTFEQWHDNIRDWCISRQLWWGHRIPVWTRLEAGLTAESASAVPGQDPSYLYDATNPWRTQGRIAVHMDRHGHHPSRNVPNVPAGEEKVYVCVHSPDDLEAIHALEQWGFAQDSDVLDTWFSSALWPLSTMGWPEPTEETKGLLEAFNPSSTLCTAREIITLWVSRMTMFNRYFTEPRALASEGARTAAGVDTALADARGSVPFRDVFIHAVIQDGEGQKMSKSLGNGVDPIDIIQTHGSDAMRFTLCTMSTHTQDVKLQVDLICPHTGEVFAPKMITNKDGYRVPAAIQESPKDKSRKMVTAYGVASGEVKATAEMPLARNTSSKFDMGRNFANKLWNASRFAVSILEKSKQSETPDTHAGWTGHTDSEDGPNEGGEATWKDVSVVDRWMVSRLAMATKEMTRALDEFEFSTYAQTLYDVIWRDFCDWYLEAIKPTVASDARQRTVLWNAMGTLLRLAHPVMPFITEVIYERLKELRMGAGELPWLGLGAPMHQGKATREGLLCHAGWPQVASDAVSPEAEAAFARVQALVTAIREVRAQQNVQPKRKVTLNFPASLAAFVTANQTLIGTLAGVDAFSQSEAKDQGVAFAFEGLQLRVTNLADAVDAGAERARLTKQVADLEKSAATFEGRLANPGYADRAPPAMVQQTRDQLAKVMKDLAAARDALAKLG